MPESVHQSLENGAPRGSEGTEGSSQEDLCLICQQFCHRCVIKKRLLHVILKGEPIAQQRPRLSKYGTAYNPQSREKRVAQMKVKSQIASNSHFKPLDGEIWVHMDFHTKIPDSWSQRRKDSVLDEGDQRRPDLDNYVKFYCDVMNEIVYRDDSCITRLSCEKRYSREPMVKITIISDGEANGPQEAPEPQGGTQRSGAPPLQADRRGQLEIPCFQEAGRQVPKSSCST